MKNPNDLKVTSWDAPEQETWPVNAMQEKLDQKPAELQTTLDMNEDGKVVQETLDKIKASGKAVFVIYRSNSIYKDLWPAIVQQLEGHGIPFTLQAFPAWTDKKEIEQRINDNIPEEQEGIYMSDQTCGSHKSSDMMDIYMDERDMRQIHDLFISKKTDRSRVQETI